MTSHVSLIMKIIFENKIVAMQCKQCLSTTDTWCLDGCQLGKKTDNTGIDILFYKRVLQADTHVWRDRPFFCQCVQNK